MFAFQKTINIFQRLFQNQKHDYLSRQSFPTPFPAIFQLLLLLYTPTAFAAFNMFKHQTFYHIFISPQANFQHPNRTYFSILHFPAIAPKQHFFISPGKIATEQKERQGRLHETA